MLATSLPFLLMGLVAAAPTTDGQYAPQSRSTGFTLVVNVTDWTRDFNPSLHGSVLFPAHDGAGLNFAALGPSDPGHDTVFYENGTAEEVQSGGTHILFDGSTAPRQVPFGIGISLGPDKADGRVAPVRVDNGPGSVVALARSPSPYTYLTPGAAAADRAYLGTFVACDTYVEYYRHNFVTVGYLYGLSTAVPQGCAPITLLPQCAKLPDLAPNQDPIGSSHAFVVEVGCYDNVAGINWS